jgi:hypothetical protein
MTKEGLICLVVEHQPNNEEALVSSPQYPLFHLLLKFGQSLEECALPLLKEFVEHEEDVSVTLRMVSPLGKSLENHIQPPPNFVIAQMAA